MGLKKMRASRPSATSWDKLNARDSKNTLANRDVYEDQQLDRAERKQIRGKSGAKVIGVVVGVSVFMIAWLLWSVFAMAIVGLGSIDLGGSNGGTTESTSEYIAETSNYEDGETVICYKQKDVDGLIQGKCYDSAEAVPIPDWYLQEHPDAGKAESADVEKPKAEAKDAPAENTLGSALAAISAMKLLFTIGLGALAGLALTTWQSKNIDAENLMRDTSDINQHTNDQHIALPEELQRSFDFAPDAGAHFDVKGGVSSMISHNMFLRKGLPKVDVVQRASEDTYDKEGNLQYYKGEALLKDVVATDDEGKALLDDDGDQVMTSVPITKSEPIIDEEFGTVLFDASGLPDEKRLRKRYDTTVIPYNAGGKNRDKHKYDSVSELVTETWEFPEYEVQRPAGAYLVDTAPVNTMVLAITRAGKGQTYIEPILDMWSREKNPSNMVVNDPKGELLVKNYIPFVMRGFEPVQFNLINPMKTDIYNPLGMAAEAAREGDQTKCAMYVENIADVFFPIDGGEDPVWPTSANNAFKRTVYGLIDFYLEEEKELRAYAESTGMSPETLEQKLDEMWGHVTLYNCYQLFVQLTATKVKNPEGELDKKNKAGDFEDDEAGFEIAKEEAEAKAFLWEGKPEQDKLTLFFNASAALPRSTMRTMVDNSHKSLGAMAGAEKMLASVYGIAITAMSFFTDPTISTLTSGRPSQNVDLGGLSFPRRMGVRFAQPYLKRDHLIGQQAVWSAYADDQFTQPMGKEFEHSDIVSREGWARYYFEGKFPEDRGWLKLELVNPQTKMLVRTFYFEFKKSYQLSLSGRHFVTEPVTGEKLVKNGVLRELRPVTEAKTITTDDGGTYVDDIVVGYEPKSMTYPQTKLDLTVDGDPEKVQAQVRAITQTTVRYSEKPKAVFLVTPPHLMKYAKLILILIKQLVDLNFDKSYMTKSNQKPLYRTRFLLDELGNLQAEGHGIANFETMLSIGLGQEQQFTLILQTLQQLRAVYGDNVDKIVQGNVSNIVFLKSTDDTMIETLEKMSGTTHRGYTESKQVSRNVKKLALKNEGNVSFTMSTKEEPLIKANDMSFIAERNSMVFRAGDAPVWNRNETILPMSHALLGASTGNKITHPGHEDYSLQTIPTLSTAMDFDVRMNQPDFDAMLEKRLQQAMHSEAAMGEYKKAHDYSELDVSRLDPDLYSDEVMEIVRMLVNVNNGLDPHETGLDEEELLNQMTVIDESAEVPNTDVSNELATRGANQASREKKIYAEGTISREMLVSASGVARTLGLDAEFGEAYKRCLAEFAQDSDHFTMGAEDELRSADGSSAYITLSRSDAYTEAASSLDEASKAKNSGVYSEEEVTAEGLANLGGVKVHAAFYTYLASLPTWEALADGAFDREMSAEMRRDDD